MWPKYLQNRHVKYYFKAIFLEDSSNIFCFPLGVGHGVKREGKEFDGLVKELVIEV